MTYQNHYGYQNQFQNSFQNTQQNPQQYSFQNPYYTNQRNVPSIAYAQIQGGPLAPDLQGYVFFRNVPNGAEVYVEVKGLPEYKPAKGNKKPIGPHGFHIHENGDCKVGKKDDPFQAAGGHWNPDNQPHGNHAGDFPVLFSNNGYARMSFFTNRFRVKDIIGKAIIIHQNPDDYRSQPAGDAGKRLACGEIKKYQ
ncbi:Cu-Zn family superoxide dismutase [Bacillus pakistanensis]|uniref:Superoxide dismutase [Cu-Zn] n=1 Tax=Rossellomorea pakistanensis TaxID=992288 RepID=A0ABS2NJ17_9BACI|nr:superoxide dismutase family protein [Bacillus pakistanensis]MBM7587800.1 Cu-Zn family superoxide dismutase [Bacillus pakistanensis]